jgi:hypothetical protein
MTLLVGICTVNSMDVFVLFCELFDIGEKTILCVPTVGPSCHSLF